MITDAIREPKASTSAPIETKPAQKKNPDIQPSKTHKSTEETSKQDKTKIIVNSVIEQNVVNQVDEKTSLQVRCKNRLYREEIERF